MATATRQVGNCQICEGDQKLQGGRLVHHGYKRPGHGHTVGSCPGVDHVPYEVSCDLLKAYKAGLEDDLGAVRTRLADIREGRVDEITKTRRSALTGKHFTDKFVRGFTDKITFDHEMRLLEAEVASAERSLEGEIRRVAARIARWAPKPVRTFEEEMQRANADKAARKAERDAARAARDAKKAATKAKQTALAEKRAAIKADFIAKFHALAQDPKANEAAARRLINELEKTKYKSWLGTWDLEDDCADDFIALGLAKVDGVRHNGRPYLRYGFFTPPVVLAAHGGGGGSEEHAWSRARARRRTRSMRGRYGRPGWHGERGRHALAARKGWLRRR